MEGPIVPRPVFVLAVLLALVVGGPAALVAPAGASPSEQYSGPHFGAGNLPPGCVRDMSPNNPANVCHHMRTGMNGLDSPEVDVLVMVPVSPTAERDMRIMRQAVEMWEGGIDYLAEQVGLGWLADGMDFHVTVDYVDPAGPGGEFTTYPIVDPEIVIIATNPVGGAGIGIDPVAPDEGPCHGVNNPFDFEAWENVPGFDNHHGGRTGTYVEDCGGAGGNVCFAINGAVDPAPEIVDVGSIFDLVAHEFGHCLTIGHVGDGAEGDWGVVPTNDIMAYSQDPPGIHKCVSSLDVEGIAVRMSKYLDVDGDGAVDDGDLLEANDPIGDGLNPFQVQHPDDHVYASSTGSTMDCPQPDMGWTPGPRTDWTPTPVETTDEVLTVTSPDDGAVSNDGTFQVAGTVEHVPIGGTPDPTEPTGSYDDADDDASTPITEITSLDVEVTATHVEATMHLADLWPSTDAASPTSYSVLIDGRKFDSFIRYPVDVNPMTWDSGAAGYMPDGTSTWDLDAKTVSFHIPRDYLDDLRIDAPYFVGSQASLGSLSAQVADDSAPDDGGTVGVASARVIDLGVAKGAVGSHAGTVTFEHEGGNTFFPEDSTLGVPQFVFDSGTRHEFSLEVAQTSDVELSLAWTDATGGSDLDVSTSGAADSGGQGGTQENPEHVVLENVHGFLDITVDPYLITDAVNGVTYTLTATVTPAGGGADADGDGVIDADDGCPNAAGPAPTGCPDTDGDGIDDGRDVCPDVPGNGANGCPAPATEHVHVYVDGVLAGSQDVDTADGPDAFDIAVVVPQGTHELRIEWEDRGMVEATRSLTVTHRVDDGGVSDGGQPSQGLSLLGSRTSAVR
jgi:hypothetical protein